MNLQKLTNIFQGDRIIWMIFFLLCIISVVEVYSSSSRLGYKSGNYWFAATYHSVILIFGVIAMIGVLNIPCRYFKLATPILVPTSILLLILVYIIGTKENDAARWIKIFGIIPIQPSEIAKGTIVLATAHILSQLQGPDGAHPNATKYILGTSLPIILLIFPENFSTAALLWGVVFIMMIIGRVPMKHIGYIISICVIAAIIVITLVLSIGKSETQLNAESQDQQLTEVVTTAKDGTVNSVETKEVDEEEAAKKKRGGILHRLDLWKQRIDNFFDKTYVAPEDYDLDKNGQVGHANIAIASSHIIGVGPGNSVQRDFLPLAFSDFIYAIIFEELGLAGAAFVALLYISLLFRTGYIARRCANPFPAFLAMGLALLIVVQALFNMMVATGLAPVTGQPLPLISKGGTSSIINCVYIGMILSISRTAKKTDE